MNEVFIVYKRNCFIDNSTYFEMNIPNNIEHYVYDNKNLKSTSFEEAGVIYINIVSNDYRDALSKLSVLSNISGINCNIIVINIKCTNEFKIEDIKDGLKKLDIKYFFRFATPVCYYNLMSVINFLGTNVNTIKKRGLPKKIIIFIILAILIVLLLFLILM